MLFGRRGEQIGGVVHGHDEERRAIAHEAPRDRRERILEADRRAVGRQPGLRDRVEPLPRHAIDRDLLDRVDPAQPATERHVLAEGDQMHLVVAIDQPSPLVEGQDARVLRAVRVVDHGPDRRGYAHRGDRLATRPTRWQGPPGRRDPARPPPRRPTRRRTSAPGSGAPRCSVGQPPGPPRPSRGPGAPARRSAPRRSRRSVRPGSLPAGAPAPSPRARRSPPARSDASRSPVA